MKKVSSVSLNMLSDEMLNKLSTPRLLELLKSVRNKFIDFRNSKFSTDLRDYVFYSEEERVEFEKGILVYEEYIKRIKQVLSLREHVQKKGTDMAMSLAGNYRFKLTQAGLVKITDLENMVKSFDASQIASLANLYEVSPGEAVEHCLHHLASRMVDSATAGAILKINKREHDDSGRETPEFHSYASKIMAQTIQRYRLPNPIFGASSEPEIRATAHLVKEGIHAPYVSVNISTLGGLERASILISLSLDPKEKWINGIYHNSRYLQFNLERDGELECFSGSRHSQGLKFRKTRVKSVQAAIDKINSYLATYGEEPKMANYKSKINKQAQWGFEGKLDSVSDAMEPMTEPTEEETEKHQHDMFGGLNQDQIREHVQDKDTFGKLMYAMSVLSDAQEEVARGNAEVARQYINRAKFIISEEMQKHR